MDHRRLALGLAFGAAFGGLAFFRGCAAQEGCMGGDDGVCVPRSPCAELVYTCAAGEVSVGTITSPDERPAGMNALAAPGDIVLQNDRVRLVLDALDAPHYLAPTGGNILDFVPRGGSPSSDDELNHVFTAVGILPGDAVRYTRVSIDDHAPSYVAVVARGHLDGRPKTTVVTRYEMRPCEPGVRVRTELFHGSAAPETFFLSDAYYWGGREVAPFVPGVGRGFVHPDLDLLELDRSFAESAFLAARPEREGAAAYAAVACGRATLAGFQSTSISAMGLPRTITMPGDALAFERFVMVGEGPGLGHAAGLALEAREKMHNAPTRELRGRVVHPGGAPVDPREHPSVLVYEPGAPADAITTRAPWTEVVPAADGTFRVRVPAKVALRVEAHALGRPLPVHADVPAGDREAALPDLVVPPVGVLEAQITGSDGAGTFGELVLTPVDPSDVPRVRGGTHGTYDERACAPWLGPAHGGSPACNRALVGADGRARLVVPEGRYFVYGTRGPFATLARADVTIVPGATRAVTLVVDPLPGLVPKGALSADFHVHAGASFDSSLPERDRARSFAAMGVDVIAATDHDLITTYEEAIRALALEGRVKVLPGAETTGHILFYRPPEADLPKVVGHYNFWPLRPNARLPRNGLPWDELLEPGPLFDAVSAGFDDKGVIQLNHPLAGSTFGRDEGYLTAIEYDVRARVPAAASDTGPGQLRRGNPGGRTGLDYHVQEVMNGTQTKQFSDYRLAWFSFLNQGLLRGGTANSDSHTLAVEVLGYPRNLVLGGHTLASFDTGRFDDDVRAGRMIGTNGPVIDATLEGAGPSLVPVAPGPGATLALEVRAAPWIPVDEIRFIVNGVLTKTLSGAALARPKDPFAKDGTVRFTGKIALDELTGGLPADRDAWIVIEAGLPLVVARDLDLDGRPDTTDNNGDGIIDYLDHLGRDDDEHYAEPGRPSPTDARFHAHVVAPGHWATAFTNPWLVDRKGDGWTAPGL